MEAVVEVEVSEAVGVTTSIGGVISMPKPPRKRQEPSKSVPPRTASTAKTVTHLMAREPSDHVLCQTHQAGKEAMAQLVVRHGGLVRMWAKRLYRREQCCTLDDLVQEGRRGLIDAAEHFDPARGSFSTCASLWIRKRMFALIEKAWQLGPQVEAMEGVEDRVDVVGRLRGGKVGDVLAVADDSEFDMVGGDDDEITPPARARDNSHLLKHFDQIEALHQRGLIDEWDLAKMRAICSPVDAQEEILKPVFALWWQRTQRATLHKVAEVVARNTAAGGSGKIGVSIQREMWS